MQPAHFPGTPGAPVSAAAAAAAAAHPEPVDTEPAAPRPHVALPDNAAARADSTPQSAAAASEGEPDQGSEQGGLGSWQGKEWEPWEESSGGGSSSEGAGARTGAADDETEFG